MGNWETRTNRKRLLKQMFCNHGARGNTGYRELLNLRVPPGWTKDENYAWSPVICEDCGYVFADLRGR